MGLTLNFPWIEAVMLAAVRMIAFLVIAPPFSNNAFPLRIKGMLGIALALAVAPRVAKDYVSPDTAGFFVGLLIELVIGALLGFLVMLVFSAIQSAGNLIDLFGGFQLAQGFDPQMMINGAQFARLYQMTALALLFASGGYQLIIGGSPAALRPYPSPGQSISLLPCTRSPRRWVRCFCRPCRSPVRLSSCSSWRMPDSAC